MGLIYTSPETALSTAIQRIEDDKLQRRIDEYLGGLWPPGFSGETDPAAVFAPYLAKGSMIEVDFLKSAIKSGYAPVVATYHDTEYVTANPGIVDCYRPPLILTKGQRTRQWIVPAECRMGLLGEAQTIFDDLDITSYWQGIRRAVLERQKINGAGRIVDFGSWYHLQAIRFGWSGQRQKSPFYYMASMALYTSGRAVLFDTPPTRFASDVMQPAFDEASEKLGAEPLIANVLTPDTRDWTDLSFLTDDQIAQYRSSGRIESIVTMNGQET